MSDDHQPGDRENTTGDGIPATNTDPNTTKNRPESKFEKLKNWMPTFLRQDIIQICIVIVGAIYCGLTYLLWHDAHEHIRRAERAYVVPTTFSLDGALESGHPVHVTYIAKNTGPTPALTVSFEDHILLTAGKHFQLIVIPAWGVVEPEPYTFLGSGDVTEPLDVWLNRPLQTDELAGIQSGKLTLTTLIHIIYSDVFDQQDWTRLCERYEPTLKQFTPCGLSTDLK